MSASGFSARRASRANTANQGNVETSPFESEFIVHLKILKWVRRNVTTFVWHTPNGGSRHVAEAINLKTLGVRRGVPDLMFVVRGRIYFLEIKNEKGRLEPEQKMFAREAQEAGAHWALVRSVPETIEACTDWGLIDDPAILSNPNHDQPKANPWLPGSSA